jgi:hypothetical protein
MAATGASQGPLQPLEALIALSLRHELKVLTDSIKRFFLLLFFFSPKVSRG